MKVMIENQSNMSEDMASSAADICKEAIETKWSGEFGKYEVETTVEIIENNRETSPSDSEKGKYNVVTLTDNIVGGHEATTGGRINEQVEIKVDGQSIDSKNVTHSVQHEAGHMMGGKARMDNNTPGSIMRSGSQMNPGEKINIETDVNVSESDISMVLTERDNDFFFDENLTVDTGETSGGGDE